MVVNVYNEELSKRVETNKTETSTGIQFFIERVGDEQPSEVVFWISNPKEREILRTAFTKAIKIVQDWKPA